MEKKLIIVFIFFVLACPATSQENSSAFLTKKSTISKQKDSIPDFPYTNNQSVGYQLLYEHTSLTGRHIYYQQTINHLPIVGSGLKVHYRHNGQIIYQVHNCVAPQFKKNNSPKTNGIADSTKFWIPTIQGLVLASKLSVQTDDLETNKDIYIDNNGSVIFEKSHNSYLKEPDSLAKVHVFFPDPITSSKSTYKGNFVDDEDNNNPDLQQQIFEKEIPVLFKDNQFLLENDYIKMIDLERPNDPVISSRDGKFYFNRSEKGFENTNAFYHISRLRMHMDSIGHKNLGNRQILIDAHGTTSDNSFYASNHNPQRILFGTGGVDDAEDATPIIHEYGHAMSDFAAPESNLGIERGAIDEGLCDYMAASYKTEISDHNWHNIYPWDGHNEFWDGRVANTTKVYSPDFKGTPHQKGEILCRALMDIYFSIGKELSDKLFFESLYYLDGEMTIPQYGNALLTVEEELYESQYKQEVCNALQSRGIVNSCYVHIDEQPSSSDVEIKNSAGFSYNNEPITIMANQTINKVIIIGTTGAVIRTLSNNSNQIKIEPSDIPVGVYVLEVQRSSSVYRTKIIKYH